MFSGIAVRAWSLEVQIHDASVWGMIASNGSIGAGEAFIHGYWSSPDLTKVIQVLVSNMQVLDALEGGLARLGRPLIRALHWVNRNTRKGSQKILPRITIWAMKCSSSFSTPP